MARSLHIFLSSGKSIAELARELSLELGFAFEKVDRDGEVFYEFFDPPRKVILSENTFINDRDLDFEQYQFDIAIWVAGVKDPLQRWQMQQSLARDIFENLKRTGAYRLMMVDDLQVKLDEYAPQ
jgi:hypothetical protein